MPTHILIGTGSGVDVPQSVINESFKDTIDQQDTIVMPWIGGKPSKALSQVYDYVLDNDVSFLLIHDGGSTIPKAFSSSEHGVVQNVANLPAAYVKNYDGGTAFVLGTDETTDEWIMAVASDTRAIEFQDLGNGLTTIHVESEPDDNPVIIDLAAEEDPTDTPPEEEEGDKDVFSFTAEELNIMPVRVLKRYALQVCPEVPATKELILEAIAEARLKAADAPQPVWWTGLASAHDGDERVAVPLGEVLDASIITLRDMVDKDQTRELSTALTFLETAALWYYMALTAEEDDQK